jgi:KDO2-lipid IV(A) lauroyltransferase
MVPTLQHVIESPFGVRFATTVGRLLPLRWGYFIADRVADLILSRPASELVRIVRANQWMAHGQIPDPPDLDQAVRKVFHQMARSIFEVYYYIQRPDAMLRLLDLDSSIQSLCQRSAAESTGMVLAGLHLSNFDLVLRLVCSQILHPLVITIPDPQGGMQLEYHMRKQIGMDIVPASPSAFRQALNRLHQGGLVLTGIDRPIPEPKLRPRFFGHPASLPIHHIFLAMKARVPIMVVAILRRPDGKYHVSTSKPIEMDSYDYTDDNALRNAEKVLAVAEGFIRQAPEQWSETLPVWPQFVNRA